MYEVVLVVAKTNISDDVINVAKVTWYLQ